MFGEITILVFLTGDVERLGESSNHDLIIKNDSLHIHNLSNITTRLRHAYFHQLYQIN